MNLVIRNTGLTLATNVRIEFDPPLQSTLEGGEGKYRIHECSLITDGIPAMPPGREYTLLFERMPDLYSSDLPRRYNVSVSFSDSRGAVHQLDYHLDLGIYFGHQRVEVYGVHHAAKATREMRDLMKKWTAHFNGIRVWTRDEESYLRSQYEEWQERMSQDQPEPPGERVRDAGDSDPDDPQVL